MITLRVSKDFLKRLDSFAKKEFRNRTNVIEMAVNEFLDKYDKKSK